LHEISISKTVGHHFGPKANGRGRNLGDIVTRKPTDWNVKVGMCKAHRADDDDDDASAKDVFQGK
jgi:hypothetical protein